MSPLTHSQRLTNGDEMATYRVTVVKLDEVGNVVRFSALASSFNADRASAENEKALAAVNYPAQVIKCVDLTTEFAEKPVPAKSTTREHYDHELALAQGLLDTKRLDFFMIKCGNPSLRATIDAAMANAKVPA
jgi:hypothetical protein